MSRVRIEDARALCKTLDNQATVILSIERDGTITVVTYGEDRKKCAAIGDWAKGLEGYALSKVPFQTVFGWGNGGTPKPLTSQELASLSRKAREYAKKYQGDKGKS